MTDDYIKRLNGGQANLTTQDFAGYMGANKEKPGRWDAFTASHLATVKTGVLGVEQMLAGAFIKDPQERAMVEQELARRAGMQNQELNYLSEQRPGYSFLGQLTGGAHLSAPLMVAPTASAGLVAGRGALAKAAIPLAEQGAREGAFLAGTNYTPEGQSRGMNATMGGLMGGVLGGGIGAGANLAGRGITNFMRGNASPEEAINALRTVKGTEVPIGEALQNPMASAFEQNVLNYIPGSGYASAQQRNLKNLKGRVEGIGEQLAPPQTSPYGEILGLNTREELLHKAHYGHENLIKEAGKNIARVDEIADKKGVNFVTHIDQFDTAQKWNDRFMEYPHERQFLSGSTLARLQQMSPKELAPSMSFAQANKLRTDILRQKRSVGFNENPLNGEILDDLARSIERDMNITAEGTGNPEIMKAFTHAKDEWIRNLKPFATDKQWQKVLQTEAHTSDEALRMNPLIAEKLPEIFVGNGKSVKQLERFTKLIGPDGTKNLRGLFFEKALDQNNVFDYKRLFGMVEGLSKGQRNSLFQDAKPLLHEIEALIRLKKANPKMIESIVNPQTGHKVLQLGIPGAAATAGFAVGGPLGSAIALGALTAGGRLGTKISTSPLTKEIFERAYRRQLGEEVPENVLEKSVDKVIKLLSKSAVIESAQSESRKR